MSDVSEVIRRSTGKTKEQRRFKVNLEQVFKATTLFSLVLLALFLIGVGPILTIMSMNMLFNLTIPISVWTWLSVVWLNLTVVGLVKSGVKGAK